MIERLKMALLRRKTLKLWEKNDFRAPSPHFIKQICLLRNGIPGATWVETGTYLGETTSKLAQVSPRVISLEPEQKLFERAKAMFSSFQNVEVINQTSEDAFPELLPTLSGDICFWLDGHFSEGITYKGQNDTPIRIELEEISANLASWRNAVVIVDDLRCFDPAIEEYSSYPTRDFLVSWAKSNELSWHIEHDMFVAIKHPLTKKY